MSRPWLLAPVCAAGVTLLVPSAFALFAPPELVDRAWMLGDRMLTAMLAGLFVASAGVARLMIGNPPEDDELIPLPGAAESQPHPDATGTHLR